jgi:uncharacterized membrane protein YhaH (DUF805 family)
MNSAFKKFIPFTLFFLFICWLIVLADLDKENPILYIGHKVPFGDKIGHFMLYGLLALLINIALKFKKIHYKNVSWLLGSSMVLIFAISEEFSQLAFESRTFDFVDMLFNVLGVLFLSSTLFRTTLKKQLLSVVKAIV